MGFSAILLSIALLFRTALSQDSCAAQPSLVTGSGPVATPDTVQAFYDLSAINSAASSVTAPTGYSVAYTNIHASSNADGYQGYSLLSSYDVSGCAAQCNSNDRCTAFNIAFERAPSREPSAADGGCPQPPSTTLIKCVLWSGPVNTDNAVNAGQLRNAFQVVIAGSNGYNKLAPPTPSGYNAAVNLGKRAISAPTCSDGTRTAIRQVFLSPSYGADPLNVTYCAGWCDTEYTRTRPCNFFNAYFGRRVDNGNAFGQVCDLYSLPWGSQYATKAQFRFDGPLLYVESSFAFTRTGASAQCAAPAPSSS